MYDLKFCDVVMFSHPEDYQERYLDIMVVNDPRTSEDATCIVTQINSPLNLKPVFEFYKDDLRKVGTCTPDEPFADVIRRCRPKGDSIEYMDFYTVLHFMRDTDVGIGTDGRWINTHNESFRDREEALDAFRNSKSPVTKLVGGNTEMELRLEIVKAQQEMEDPEWVNENVQNLC